MTRNLIDQDTTPSSTGSGNLPVHAVLGHVKVLIPAIFGVLLLIASAALPNQNFYEPIWLLPSLNAIFLTLMPLLVAILSARGFLNDHSPVLLLFGCSMLILGIGGSIAGVLTVTADINVAMQVWNMTALLLGLCNLAAALQLFLDPMRRLARVRLWLVGGYAASVCSILLIIALSSAELLPVFFTNGEGATPIRQLILYLSVGFCSITSALLFIRNVQTNSRFLNYYALGMAMIAIGLLGTYSIKQNGTIQNWSARICMYVGGVYLFVAGISSIRQGRWSIPINILHETHWRYERLVAFCPDSIMVHVDGRFVFANAATAQLLKLGSPDELIGKPVMDFIHPDSRNRILHRITKVLAQDAPVPLSEVHMLRSDGTRIEVETIAVSVEYEGRPAVLVVARDITERRRAEEARRLIEQRYRSLFEGMTEGFALHEIILDEAGNAVDYRFLDVNPSFERFTGLRREDVVGHTKREVLPNDDPSWIEIYGRVALTGEPIHFEQRSAALDRFYEVVAYRPAPRQFAVLFLDVSDRKRMEMDMRSARESAERANRAKDDFLARLSHELRTPLTPVLLTASLLEKRTDLPEDLRQDILTIRQNVLLEARLIDDLLDLTRIAKGKIQFDFQPVDLHAIVENTVAICSSIPGPPITLSLQAREITVMADSARLQQVIWNLLNNARKFTSSQGKVHLVTRNPQPGIVSVTVTDSGIGIEPEFLPRVFNAFEQAQGAIVQAPGLGLGLAIAKAIVDAHNGTISAHSDGPGKGAEFSFELRCVSSQISAERHTTDDPLLYPDDHKKLNVLLVEDHASTRQVMQKLLKVLGHSVTAVEDIRSALAASEKDKFDFVVSDIGLPDGSGNELMIRLRERSQIRGIALSGYGMEEDKQRSLAAGFIAHLTKPVSLEQLEFVLREASKNC